MVNPINEPAEREAFEAWRRANGSEMHRYDEYKIWLARARVAAEREATLLSLLKRAQVHVPHLGETYLAIEAALTPEKPA